MKILALAVITAAVAGFAPPGQTALNEGREGRPNFVFLLSDDQTFRALGCLGDSPLRTPQLDRLAGEGMLFTHVFNQGSWSGAVCICSRAMLHTGQFLFHAQQSIDRAPLWGETLGRAGYRTFAIGKWHNGQAAALRGFQAGRAQGAGMYEAGEAMYHRPADGNGWRPWDRALGGHWKPAVWDFNSGKAGSDYTVETHTSELYADEAIRFLREEVSRDERPFFLYVAFNAPHDPRQAPKEWVDLYPVDSMPLPPNYLPEHPFDQGDARLRDEILAPFPRTEAAVRLHLAEYFAILSHMDHQIGRILEALDASGERDETYVIFTSDHGLAVGQHGLLGKQNQYEHSIRVPFLARGPGIAAGSRCDALVYLQSSYATTCELAGVAVPETVEFPSLVPLLRGHELELHSAIFGAYKEFQRMVRTRHHKLILYPEAGVAQLFDLDSDPWERTDLVGSSEAQGLRAGLLRRLVDLQAETGDRLELDPAWFAD
ncbi:MAG TPA: sulfatase-like hydrolase/transferase [Verrucomicrobiales bacterium]|nr:sulfatase-like hydrolase/transferase [Verrucomicrobiales bacterium]